MTRVAAIDCGTHSIRLLVAEAPACGSTLTDIIRRMEIVRLGEGVDRTGRLAPAAIERARIVLCDYARQISEAGADRIRMVATSASRDAEDAEEFRRMVKETLGIPPEVISGDEEARLSFAGAVSNPPPDLPDPVLVVDLGGGSTEFVVGRWDGTVTHAVSVDVGCARMTERHLLADPPTVAQREAAREEIAALVDSAFDAVSGGQPRSMIGLAGSITTVVGIAYGLDQYRPEMIHHARITYSAIARICDELLAATRAERLAIPVMHQGRAAVIGAGALILRTVMERFGFDELVASEHDILDGIACSLT
ncbi:MAG: Ppx/GppA family phosphatase [Micromonosporaceae bacterium]|nr:Ppx/GppA family phosphatase [Micromonosporaceae bacterium]